MLFKTRYSQETLEHFKSLVHDEKLLKKVTGFIHKERWIYFEPEPFNRISEKKLRQIIGVRSTRMRKPNPYNCNPFAFQ